MQETVKTAILIGVAVVLLIAIAYIATLGRRGKIVATLLLVVGLGIGTTRYFTWSGDRGRRQAIMVTVSNFMQDRRPLKDLPADQLEWLFSKAGWTPEDLGKVDSLASAVGRESKTIGFLDQVLSAKEGDSLLEVFVEYNGPNWRQDAEERKAISVKIEAAWAPFVPRGQKALRESDPDALVTVAREYVAVITPLGDEYLAMRRRQLQASKK